ncbi:N-acetylmuramic acid 6-phosphate etherase [Oceanobacillus sojae]|uniref:N-acetylmuramic acid 6-phosphate etherase n=1 Tax=Oceanobacillus sojae TaxID=582851 RepID=UPI000988883C|nr:N-acetylmuramic acid 6-phosphate etherase [Oceanobacillus sojae]
MLGDLTTEKRNEKTMNLDEMSTEAFLKIMNGEDAKVAYIIKENILYITEAVNNIITSLKSGGRLIYLGAGTSGRLGLLDAVECPPTFGTDPKEVIGLISGGNEAFIQAVEGAEDNEELGRNDLQSIHLTDSDIVVGIAASGRTPYVIGGLQYANDIGAATVAVSNNRNSTIGRVAKTKIEVDCGPEVLSGSTRLKAGTAQKMILNMLSTASMVGVGKTYQNLLVDLQPTNEKLKERAKKIIMEATQCDFSTAEAYFKMANYETKTAIIMLLTDLSYDEAVECLKKTEGSIHKTIEK